MDLAACFYINLDERPDRRSHMERQLERLGGVPVERWAAIRPTEQTLGTTYARYMQRGVAPYLRRYQRRRRRRERYYGVIGCYLSHVRLMEQVVARCSQEDGAVLVFEDDVVLEPDFFDVLRKKLSSLVFACGDWDLVRIDCWGERLEECRVDDDIYRLSRRWEGNRCFGGFHAVIFMPSRMPNLLRLLETHPIGDIDGLRSKEDLVRAAVHYVVYTGRCTLARFSSDVRPTGPNRLRWWIRRIRGAPRVR